MNAWREMFARDLVRGARFVKSIHSPLVREVSDVERANTLMRVWFVSGGHEVLDVNTPVWATLPKEDPR